MSNKMKLTNILFLCCICCLAACQKHKTDTFDDGCIYLYAGTKETKSPYTESVPSESSPLEALVCVSTVKDAISGSYVFPSDGSDGTEDGTIGKHIQAEFQSGTAQLINGAYYNQSYPDTDVHFVAVHPQSGWTFTDGTTAETTLNGYDDIMFAPRVTGRYSSQTHPELEFNHLLTWIRIEISADSEEVATAWGPLQSMTIQSRSKVQIPLGKETFSTEDVVFTGADIQMPFIKIGKDGEIFPDQVSGYTMTETPVETAYVLCAPVQATEREPSNDDIVRTPEYYINIVSRYRNVTVPIDLMETKDTYFTGSTMGAQFTLRLNFKLGNTISVSANITDWSTGGIGIGKIEE